MVTPEASPRPPLPKVGARHIAAVLESHSVGTSFHKLRLACPAIARAARPGQFVHVLPGALAGADTPTASYGPLLRRAFSIMSTSSMSTGTAGAADASPGSGDIEAPCNQTQKQAEQQVQGAAEAAAEAEAEGEAWFDILFRVGGQGTSLLARSRIGDLIDVLGPLGNGFTIERAGEEGSDSGSGALQRPLFLVGGGIGVPPLIFAIQELRARDVPSVSHETGADLSQDVEVFVGARTSGDLVGLEELRQAGARLHICTDDGSQGQRGLVTQPLRQRLGEISLGASGSPSLSPSLLSLDTTSSSARGAHPPAPLVCACGPWPMLRAVAALCASMDVECRVSLEENMPCGIGVCNGCVVPMLDAADDYGKFQRICVQGPVLDARSVDWSASSGPSSNSPAPASARAPAPARAPASARDALTTPEQEGASQ